MPIAHARAILPEAEYRPPARQSDVMSAVRIDEPAVIALIDGTFAQSLSVWHKEILYALERGVHVYGASSMGALRAAECHRFGMVGVGRIFERFASGELIDDDEVALAHGAAEEGYRPLTEAMVNVRATLDAAQCAGAIEASEASVLLASAKRTYFAERTWAAVMGAAVADGLAPERAAELSNALMAHRVDQKRADAEELLARLATLPDTLEPAVLSEPLARSHTFLALLERDRRVRRDAGEVSLEAIARHVLLHDPGATATLDRALGRELASAFADFLGLSVSDELVADERARFCAERRLRDERAVAEWQRRNDLDGQEFAALITSLATARRLRAWLVARRFKRKAVQPLLDQLRIEGTYEKAADAAAAREADLAAIEHDAGTSGGEPVGITRKQLLAEHARHTGWLPDTSLEQWALEVGFEDAFDVYIELLRSRALRRKHGG